MKRLIFIDSVGSADEYLRSVSSGRGGGSDKIISMTPRVRAYLKNRGIDSEGTLRYFSNASHEGLLRQSKETVSWLEDKAPLADIDEWAKNSYRDIFITWARFAVHHCLWIAENVSNAVDAEKPDVVMASSNRRRYARSLYIEPEERYLPAITRKIAARRGVFYEDIGRKTPEVFYALHRAGISVFLNLKFLVSCGRFRVTSLMLYSRRFFSAGRKTIFYTSAGYNLGRLASGLVKDLAGTDLSLLPGPVMNLASMPDWLIWFLAGRRALPIIRRKRLLRDFAVKMANDPSFPAYREISLAPFVSKKIADNISNFIIGQFVWAGMLEAFLRRTGPCALLSNGERHDDPIIARLAARLNTRSILISHGSHVAVKNEFEKIEWGEHGRTLMRMPFSVLALQSTLAERYLDSFPASGKTVKTGPLLWGLPVDRAGSKAVFEKIFSGRRQRDGMRIITHAGTPKRTKNIRFYVYETPDEYLEALRSLAAAVENLENTFLIVRFRPREEISVEDLKSFVPFSQKVLLSIDEAFLDVLGMSDLLVSFSSTAIEEALQNRIPVLLYGGGGRYMHTDAFDVKRGGPTEPAAVYHIKEAAGLESGLNSILRLKAKTGSGDRHLFDRYIYPGGARTALAAVVRGDVPE